MKMCKKRELLGHYELDELRKLQLEEVSILEIVAQICDKHQIKYFLWGGTAIGAVRHKGFIPWDDDIDISVLRKDYDVLLDILEKELPKGLFLQTPQSDNAPFYFAKVRKNDTVFLEHYCIGKEMHQGIYIDIFPLDNVPDDEKERKKFLFKYKIAVQLYNGKNLKYTFNPRNSMLKKVIRWVLHALLTPVPKRFLYNKLDKLSRKYQNVETKKVKGAGIDSKLLWDRKDFDNTIEVNFEGRMFKLPIGNHNILTITFGDYMKLPPEDKRFNHRPIEIKFNVAKNDKSEV